MAYVVKKPLNIAGRRREIGEILQDDEVRSASVIRSKLVAHIAEEASDKGVEGEKENWYINAPVITKEGTQVISVAVSGICEALLLLQMSSADAVTAVGTATDADMLRIVQACTANTKLKAAVKARMEELQEDPEKGGE